MGIETSTVLEFAFIGMNTYVDSDATPPFFCSVFTIVPKTMVDISSRSIELANDTIFTVIQQGDVVLPFVEANLRLTDVLLVPNLGYNLFSVVRTAE